MSLITKIKIDVTLEQLVQVTSSMADIPVGLYRKDKSQANILELVCIKLLKKQLSKRHESGYFKLSLEFFEADFLERYLISFNSLYNNHEIQQVINSLNQKLA